MSILTSVVVWFQNGQLSVIKSAFIRHYKRGLLPMIRTYLTRIELVQFELLSKLIHFCKPKKKKLLVLHTLCQLRHRVWNYNMYFNLILYWHYIYYYLQKTIRRWRAKICPSRAGHVPSPPPPFNSRAWPAIVFWGWSTSEGLVSFCSSERMTKL